MKYFFYLFFMIPFLFSSCSSVEQKNEKPNILFIMSDDHAYQAISAYDDRLIQTPNIDRIANEGMLFTNASVIMRPKPAPPPVIRAVLPFKLKSALMSVVIFIMSTFQMYNCNGFI